MSIHKFPTNTDRWWKITEDKLRTRYRMRVMSEQAITETLEYAKTKHYENSEKIPLLDELFKIELAEKSEDAVRKLPIYPYLYVFFEMVDLYASTLDRSGARNR